MADVHNKFMTLVRDIERQQRLGNVAEFRWSHESIQVRPVGSDWLSKLLDRYIDLLPEIEFIRERHNEQAYYFLSQQLRPGSGLIRVAGGRSEGPGGTLTCFLSSKDGRDNYFAAAGHVLTNFWTDEDIDATPPDSARPNRPTASIYRYQKGFPATNSTRFLGKLAYISEKIWPINHGPVAGEPVNQDIGIVRIQGEVDPVQRTTCYGSFGEWPSNEPPEKLPKGLPVMKCGAEEAHWTHAVVTIPSADVSIYGPGGLVYKLKDQVILEVGKLEEKGLEEVEEGAITDPPPGWSAEKYRRSQRAFGLPGDSGSMVVEEESRRPVGMLVAGSVLDGRYVMTPFRTIWKFWDGLGLILRRG